MPFVHLRLAGREPAPAQRAALQAGLTELMQGVLRKQAPLTVVAIDCVPAQQWSTGGQALADGAWAAQLSVYISAGTNTSAERGRFVAAAHALLRAQWESAPRAPLYVIVHEVALDSWGYDGLTQQARAAMPAPFPAVQRPATLRALAGQPPARAPGPAATALLLIDFQREYADGRLALPGLHEAARHATRLAAAADAAGIPVIHVHHEAASGAAQFFARGSQGAQPIVELPVAAQHHRIVKRLPSAFHATPLAALLERLQVKNLVLAGCMTHNCVDSTAREALHRGFAVLVAADACAARDLPGINGELLLAAQVHAGSLAALADRHVDVLAAQALVEAWAPGRSG
jgi:nicotinamidase-related amidase/phenylpyruvate tautomerase PptA (4-oxalocrotonate tautomerase family)